MSQVSSGLLPFLLILIITNHENKQIKTAFARLLSLALSIVSPLTFFQDIKN